MASRVRSTVQLVWTFLFALPFLGVGVGMAYTGLRLVLGGQGTGVMALVFGLVFGGAGLRTLVQTFSEFRSAEALAAKGTPPILGAGPEPPAHVDYRLAGHDRTAREAYAAELAHPAGALAVLPTRRGQTLAWALGVTESLRSDVVFSAVWTGFTLPMFVLVAASRQSVAGTVFVGLFVLVGLFIGFRAFRRWLARQRLPRVEIDAEPAFLGSPVRVQIVQEGPAKVTRIRARAFCKEHVTFMEGTDKRTESADVLELPLFDEVGVVIGRGERWTQSLDLQLPGGPPSFAAEHNRVEWGIRVDADLDGWPDYDETFVFRAVPRPGGS